jgi:hypothetical protein
VVYLGNFSILNYQGLFMMSPDQSMANWTRFLARAAELDGLGGVHFAALGGYVYANYNTRRYVPASETVALWGEMMRQSQAAHSLTTVDGGNAYALPYADLVTEIPYADNGYQFSTRAVPFYQMVTHGSVQYTALAGNLSPDLDRELLTWVEYGYTPYFELTWDGSQELMYTGYTLYASKFADWQERVTGTLDRLSAGGYERLSGAYMMEHAEPLPGVRRVRYDNGLTVYVNYNEQVVTIDGIQIPGLDFIIQEEG